MPPPPNTPDDGDIPSVPSLADDHNQRQRQRPGSGRSAELERLVTSLPYHDVFTQQPILLSPLNWMQRTTSRGNPASEAHIQPTARDISQRENHNSNDVTDAVTSYELMLEALTEIEARPPQRFPNAPSNDYMVQDTDEGADENKPRLDWQSLTYQVDADTELLCPICQTPFCQPVVTKCGHTFCTSCLVTHLETQVSPAGKSCAVCRTPFFNFNTDLLDKPKLRRLLSVISDPSPRIINNMLDKLLVECPNSRALCTWVGPRSTVEKHVADDCPYTLVSCAEKNCAQKLTRKAAKGKTACLHYTVCCEYCQEPISMAEHLQHLERDCPDVLMPCGTCLQSLRRKDMDQHLDACWDETTVCSFSLTGCPMQGTRREAREHEKTCVYAHLHQIEQRMNSKMETVDALQREHRHTTMHMRMMQQRMTLMDEHNERVKAFLRFLSGVLDVRNEARREGQPEGPQNLEHYIELDGRINDLAQTIANQDQHHAMALNTEIGRLRQENLDFRRQFSAVTIAMRRLTNELPGRGSSRSFLGEFSSSSTEVSRSGSERASSAVPSTGSPQSPERLASTIGPPSRQSISSEPRPSL